MKPILFAKDETDFTTNGLGRLDCISCHVIEERNGMYELEAEIPITGTHASDIEMLSIIGVIPHDGGTIQPFYVYKITKPINGRFTIYARHISYRLSDIPCSPFSISASGSACSLALAGLKSHAIEACPFTFSTDVTTANSYTQKLPASIRQRLGGVEGSILDQFGGEYEWDKFDVKLWNSRGRLANTTGISLRYGKNITDINQEEEIANTVTGIYPYWADSNGDNLVTLNAPVYSSNAGNYPYHLTQVLDLSGEFQEKPTTAQLQAFANIYVNKSGFGVPKVNIKVSFVNLWETEEYKDIAPLERVQLCDEIYVQFEKLGVSALAKVVKTDYDVLKERYNNIEVGSIRTTLAQAITDRDKDIDTAFIEQLTRINGAISDATAWLTSANGYVVAVKNQDGSWKELLFMNTNDPTTATAGVRINNNGIGFFSKAQSPSGNVLDGPYSTAWTIDGRLGDFANKNFWNFITGEFSLSAGTTVGGQTVQQIADAAEAAAEAAAAAALASTAADLQNQIDGNITTWFYAYAPTTSNAPASTWTTVADKSNHIGDLFYDSTTGYCYRWQVKSTASDPSHPTINDFEWVQISDEDIAEALAKAQTAQDTADNKRRVFVATPVPPYDIGDLWVQGSSGDIKRCATAKTSSQTYSSSDWVLASKYTDDSALTAWVSGTYATDKTNLQNQIDGKAETWYQSSDPSTAWTTATLKAQHVGDLWYDTDDDTTWFYYHDTANNTYSWVQQNVPTAVFDKIDGKAQIFTSTPTPPYNVGDLWFNSASSDILTCTTAKTSSQSYASTDWVKRNKYTDDSAVTALNNSLDQDEIFDRLTGGGTNEGIYLQSGHLYLNASKIMTGILDLGGTSVDNPTIRIKDSNGNVIGTWTRDGIEISNSSGTTVFKITAAGVMTISGYAKTSDIPDVSGYATKSGLAQQNYTTINGGNITTGEIKSSNYSAPSSGHKYANAGTKLNLTNGQLISKSFNMDATSNEMHVRQLIITADDYYDSPSLNYLKVVHPQYPGRSSILNHLGLEISNVSDFSGDSHTVEIGPDYFVIDKYWEGSGAGYYTDNSRLWVSLKDGFVHRNGSRSEYAKLYYDSLQLYDSYYSPTREMWINAGGIYKTDSVQWTVHWYESDRRIKEDIKKLQMELSLKFIDETETVSFRYIGKEGKHYGVIAQDVRELLDSLGETDAELEHGINVPKELEDRQTIKDQRTVEYHEYIPHLINYVKDLREIVDKQQKEIDELKTMLKKLSI